LSLALDFQAEGWKMVRLPVLLTVCGCVVLALPQGVSGQDKQEVQRLKDRIEQLEMKLDFLKKETEFLKRDNDLLRREFELFKKESGKSAAMGKDDTKKGLPRTTVDGVAFQVLSSKVNGANWELSLAVLSENADKVTRVEAMRALTEEGQEFGRKLPLNKQVNLPLGQKVQMKLNLGPLPKTISALSTVELHCVGKGGVSYVVVFKDLPIER